MKKIILLLFLLSTPFIHVMENQKIDNMDGQSSSDYNFPPEIWICIAIDICFNPSLLDKADNIDEGIALIQKCIPEYCKTLSFVCKTFRALTISQYRLIQKETRKLFIPHLNQRFLETRENNNELHPKNSNWYPDIEIFQNNEITNNIAHFVATAVMPNNIAMVQLFIENQNNFTPLLKLMNTLFFYGGNFDTKDYQGQTLLHAAIVLHKYGGFCCYKHESIIKLLLTKGANPNIRDMKGETPLGIALSMKHGENCSYRCIIALLLEHNANANIQDLKGVTPLHSAVYHHDISDIKSKEIIILLLKYGANPNIKANGQTAFDIAQKKNFDEFPQLARKYAQNTLAKICILHVLNNLSLYQDKLDALPKELQDKINSLRSD